jgi:hypothetical protein
MAGAKSKKDTGARRSIKIYNVLITKPSAGLICHEINYDRRYGSRTNFRDAFVRWSRYRSR